MNRSILIVICDFLLVSLLAFSTVDINKVADSGAPVQMQMRTDLAATNAAAAAADSGRDLAAVMRLALEEERQHRDVLMGELAKARATASEREQLAQSLQEQLQSREQQARQLREQQAGLQQQFSAAQTNLQSLAQQLQTTSTEAAMSQEQLAALQAELRKQNEQAAELQKQLETLSRSNQLVLKERQQLVTRLQVAEVERRHAAEQAAAAQEQVKLEREEKAKLAEGFSALATKSGQLAQEIRENRPLAPNTIFNDVINNRVQAQFAATRSGFFGDKINQKMTDTVLVTDGTNTFAVSHVEDTPLTLWSPGTDWEQLSGWLARNGARTPIHSLSFHLRDPRVVFMPVTQAEAGQLGGKIYRTSADPYKFQDAVLIGAREGYYGECKFEIDVTTPGYVKLDRSVLKGLFGKFNPSRGDLVFSKTGELLGVMVNSTYCLMMSDFMPAATFQFGPGAGEQHTGMTLSSLYSTVMLKPLKLQ